jgi:hypothetical protein
MFSSYTSSQASSQNEESSSSSEEDEKFQIKIRPADGTGTGSSLGLNSSRTSLGDYNSDAVSMASGMGSAGVYKIPLLPRPPRTANEIEELRQRRLSSDTASITRSIKNDDDESSSGDDETNRQPRRSVVTKQKSSNNNNEGNSYAVGDEILVGSRKGSVESEYLLELPDEDDLAPLPEFNDKSELRQYSDGSYSVTALVRQPFRSPQLLYKNALQKMTEVRSWLECLVRLVDSNNGTKTGAMPSKKLLFYNYHDLMQFATQLETTVEKLLETSCTTTDEKIKTMLSRKIVPFYEIEIKSAYKFSEMSLQQYDTYTKIHTFKVQEPIYKETVTLRPDKLMQLPGHFMKRFTKAKSTSLLDHTAIPLEICKFAHMDFKTLRAFLLLLQDVFWSMPTISRKEQRKQQLEQLNLNPVSGMSIGAAAASLFSLGVQNKQIQAPSLNSVTGAHVKEQITIKVILIFF